MKLLNRIVATLTKRLTSQDPFYSHPTPAQNSVFINRLARILRTCRLKSTRRRQKRRHESLVNAQQIENQKFHLLTYSATAEPDFTG